MMKLAFWLALDLAALMLIVAIALGWFDWAQIPARGVMGQTPAMVRICWDFDLSNPDPL